MERKDEAKTGIWPYMLFLLDFGEKNFFRIINDDAIRFSRGFWKKGWFLSNYKFRFTKSAGYATYFQSAFDSMYFERKKNIEIGPLYLRKL